MDGTDSNQLFIQASADSHEELILTPRQGGPTPPNPNPPAFDDEEQSRTRAENSSSHQQAAIEPPVLPPSTEHADAPNDAMTHANPAENSESTQSQSTPAAEAQPVIGDKTSQETAQQSQ